MADLNRRRPSILESFNYALEGIVHVLRTQRNMRIHFGIAVAVLIAGLWTGVNRLELIALLRREAGVRPTSLPRVCPWCIHRRD